VTVSDRGIRPTRERTTWPLRRRTVAAYAVICGVCVEPPARSGIGMTPTGGRKKDWLSSPPLLLAQGDRPLRAVTHRPLRYGD
jgi:hypothetical protein